MWTVLVQTVGINFSAIVAVNHGDGQKLGPSIDLLAKMLWISYLVLYYYSLGYHTGPKNRPCSAGWLAGWLADFA